MNKNEEIKKESKKGKLMELYNKSKPLLSAGVAGYNLIQVTNAFANDKVEDYIIDKAFSESIKEIGSFLGFGIGSLLPSIGTGLGAKVGEYIVSASYHIASFFSNK